MITKTRVSQSCRATTNALGRSEPCPTQQQSRNQTSRRLAVLCRDSRGAQRRRMVAQGGAAGGTLGRVHTTSRSPEGATETSSGSFALSGLPSCWTDTQGSAFGSTLGYRPAPLRGLKTASWLRANLRALRRIHAAVIPASRENPSSRPKNATPKKIKLAKRTQFPFLGRQGQGH